MLWWRSHIHLQSTAGWRKQWDGPRRASPPAPAHQAKFNHKETNTLHLRLCSTALSRPSDLKQHQVLQFRCLIFQHTSEFRVLQRSWFCTFWSLPPKNGVLLRKGNRINSIPKWNTRNQVSLRRREVRFQHQTIQCHSNVKGNLKRPTARAAGCLGFAVARRLDWCQSSVGYRHSSGPCGCSRVSVRGAAPSCLL